MTFHVDRWPKGEHNFWQKVHKQLHLFVKKISLSRCNLLLRNERTVEVSFISSYREQEPKKSSWFQILKNGIKNVCLKMNWKLSENVAVMSGWRRQLCHACTVDILLYVVNRTQYSCMCECACSFSLFFLKTGYDRHGKTVGFLSGRAASTHTYTHTHTHTHTHSQVSQATRVIQCQPFPCKCRFASG